MCKELLGYSCCLTLGRSLAGLRGYIVTANFFKISLLKEGNISWFHVFLEFTLYIGYWHLTVIHKKVIHTHSYESTSTMKHSVTNVTQEKRKFGYEAYETPEKIPLKSKWYHTARNNFVCALHLLFPEIHRVWMCWCTHGQSTITTTAMIAGEKLPQWGFVHHKYCKKLETEAQKHKLSE